MSGSKTIDLERAEGLVVQALSASPRNPLIHVLKGAVLRAKNRWEEAIPDYETALARLPSPVWSATILVEQNDEWAVQRARYMTLETIAPLSEDPIFKLPAVAA